MPGPAATAEPNGRRAPMTTLRDAAMNSKAWPFEEARRVLKRYAGKDPEKGYVLF